MIRRILTVFRDIRLQYKNSRSTPKAPRHDDVYIVEHPKSGITWLSFILANLIVYENKLNRTVTFFNVNDFVPDIHFTRDIGPPFYVTPGFRLIKSHSLHNPEYKKVIYLWRDPVMVMRSYYRMLSDLQIFDGSYEHFVTNSRFGVASWIAHVSSWLYQSTPAQRMHFVNYDELSHHPFDIVSGILRSAGWACTPENLRSAINGSAMPNMQQEESFRIEHDKRRKGGLVTKSYRFVGSPHNISGEIERVDEYIRAETESLTRLLQS